MSNTTSAIFKIFIAIAVVWLLLMIYLAISTNDLCHRKHGDSNNRFYVRTSGCRIRNLEHLICANKIIEEHKSSGFDADKNYLEQDCPLPLTRVEGRRLAINLDKKRIKKFYRMNGDLHDVNCSFTGTNAFDSLDDQKYEFNLTEKTVALPDGASFIQVECVNVHGHSFYKNGHFVVDEVNSQAEFSSSVNKHCSQAIPRDGRKRKVSILLIAIDNTTHHDFIASFPQTAKLLRNQPTFIEYWGYNKFANLFAANMLPLLKGVTECEHNAEYKRSISSKGLPQVGFIWDAYKDAGYRTFYAESGPNRFILGDYNFNFDLKFVNTERSTSFLLDQTCSSDFGRATLDVMRQMIPHYKKHDFFSLYWLAKQYDRYTSADDRELSSNLQDLLAEGISERTFIVLVSNSPQDMSMNVLQKQNNRLPLLAMIYPKFVEQEYPLAIYNLRQNAHRLVTPFDVHATLNDLKNLDNLEEDILRFESQQLQKTADRALRIPFGNSFFINHFCSRTCLDAGVPEPFCACHEYGEERKCNQPSKVGNVIKNLMFF